MIGVDKGVACTSAQVSSRRGAQARLMKLLFTFIFLFFSGPSYAQSSEKECVILLHGMGRTPMSMWNVSYHLSQAGYQTVNYGYPSTSFPIEELTAVHVPAAIEQCNAQKPAQVHFVTHSLGGILVRYYLQTSSLPRGSRIIMISPPNQGSDLADRFKDKKMPR